MNQSFDDVLAFLDYFKEVWTKDKYLTGRNLNLDMPSVESQALVNSFMSWINPIFPKRILLSSITTGSYESFLRELKKNIPSLEDQLFLIKKIYTIFGYDPGLMKDLLSNTFLANGIFFRARILDEISEEGEVAEALWEENPNYIAFILALYDNNQLKLSWEGITDEVVLKNLRELDENKTTIDYKHPRVKSQYVRDYIIPLWEKQGRLSNLKGFWKSVVKTTILKKGCDSSIIEDYLVDQDQTYEELVTTLNIVPGTIFGVVKNKNFSLSNYFHKDLLPEEAMEIFQHLVSWVEEDQDEVLEHLLFVNPLPRLLFNRALYHLKKKGHEEIWYNQARSRPELLLENNLKRLMRILKEKRSKLKPESIQGIKLEKFNQKLRKQAKSQGLTLHSLWG